MRSNNGRIGIIIGVISIAVIIGYFTYQTYGLPQTVQNEANNVINKASNTIQKISPILTNLSSSQSKALNFGILGNRVPIAVYDDCNSELREDLKEIDTSCQLLNGEKRYTFVLPSEIEQLMQPGEAISFVSTKVYQYGTNDFTIWLSDQRGGKNYTVSLSQLPSSSGLPLYIPKYGASEEFIPTTNILTTSVRSTVIPWSYTVTIKDSRGNVVINKTFTATESSGLDMQSFDLSRVQQTALLQISIGGQQIFSSYVGSPFTEPQNQNK